MSTMQMMKRWLVDRLLARDANLYARLKPVSLEWGFDRGTPIDRYYIESFLEQHRSTVRGDVLELLNNDYTRRYGNDKVIRSHILDIDSSNTAATIVVDLAKEAALPPESFDCIIFTQALQHIYDITTVLRNLYNALKPEGSLLLTVPSIIKYHREPTDYWRFTPDAVRILLNDCGAIHADVTAFGNYNAALAFLAGAAVEDIGLETLVPVDASFPVSICARVKKQ